MSHVILETLPGQGGMVEKHRKIIEPPYKLVWITKAIGSIG